MNTDHSMRNGVTRREFVGMCGASVAMAATGTIAGGAKAELPAYYDAYLKPRIDRISALAVKCVDGFTFLTDIHVPANCCRSGLLCSRIVEATGLKKVLFGGDLPEAFGGRESIDRTIVEYRRKWVDVIESSGGEFYAAKGNHDFTIRADAESQSGFTYSGEYAKSVLMDTKAIRANAVVNSDDPECCYYYFDNPKAKLRYIVADTTDTVDQRRTWWAVALGMHERQLLWLAEHALAEMPEGFGAIIMHHIPVVGVVGEDKEVEIFDKWRQVMEAYQNRGCVTMFGRTFDYSAAKGKILFDLTGHHHAERETFQRGIWHMTQPCDARYRDYIDRAKPWCPDLPEKTPGTVYEHTMDVIQVDSCAHLLHFTRIGGGGNRTFHLECLSATVGVELPFATHNLGGDISWGCYDADRAAKRQHPTRRYHAFYDYFNDVADISPDGKLRPKKPGECVVVALAADGDKEIFAVKVS